MHLAQLNIARLKFPIDSPEVSEFVDNLDRINALAERSDGFAWRLTDDNGSVTDTPAFDDPMLITNMSVWRDAESLEHFVWNTVHKQIYRKRAEWFSVMDKQHFVMWWVDEGYQPTLEEAKRRLQHLHESGDSDFAFGWAHLPHVKLWQQARCA
jgi:hypothetical protein